MPALSEGSRLRRNIEDINREIAEKPNPTRLDFERFCLNLMPLLDESSLPRQYRFLRALDGGYVAVGRNLEDTSDRWVLIVQPGFGEVEKTVFSDGAFLTKQIYNAEHDEKRRAVRGDEVVSVMQQAMKMYDARASQLNS